jgi:hypothetical protein
MAFPPRRPADFVQDPRLNFYRSGILQRKRLLPLIYLNPGLQFKSRDFLNRVNRHFSGAIDLRAPARSANCCVAML